jgi:hypothetical protein
MPLGPSHSLNSTTSQDDTKPPRIYKRSAESAPRSPVKVDTLDLATRTPPFCLHLSRALVLISVLENLLYEAWCFRTSASGS